LNWNVYINKLSRLYFTILLLLFSQTVWSQVTKLDVSHSFVHNKNIPLPNGELVTFKLTPENIMADELAIKYPNIKTFSGVSLDNPYHTGRFDITPNGFHGMFYYQGKRVFVEPQNIYTQVKIGIKSKKSSKIFDNPTNEYKSYFNRDDNLANRSAHRFHQPKTIPPQYSTLIDSKFITRDRTVKNKTAKSTIKTYRIAISAAAEYTTFNGGTVDSAMAEIVTLVNRLNEVYQRDLAVKLELVGNNELLIYTDVDTDPFNNDSDDGELNTNVIDSVIGSENYDIGHVVNTNGGGLAVLGGVCHSLYKGDGITGDSNPTNDAFYIDYVAHEIGHQFGAEHTFNGTAGACSGNRVADSAYEVGSGSTIMAYAGICDDQNLQLHSDAFFHARSLDQINEYIQNNTGNTCGSVTGTANNRAIVNAGLDYIIPSRTPFKLSGEAEDIDSPNLTYSWQQFDLGTESSSVAEQIDDGSRPLFRALFPNSEAFRYFPKISNVLNQVTSIGETLPTTKRELNFRLMVSDNEGGVSFDEVKLTVVDTSEAFALTSPILDDIWTASRNSINWQVAATDVSPINCSAVDILLSKNKGESFEVTLARNIANNGSTELSIDSFCANEINTTQARIKLVCSNNIFFAINNGVFGINKEVTGADIAMTSQQTLSLIQGESIELAKDQFTYKCETPDLITIQRGDNYSFTGTTIIPNSDFSGILFVRVIANKNDISSDVFMVRINVDAKPEPPVTKSSGSIAWLLLGVFILPWRTWVLSKKRNDITLS